MCTCMSHKDQHFLHWFPLITEKNIRFHVCSSLNKQSEGCWASADKWDITDVDKTHHHPESISLSNYTAMQELFGAEIAMRVFNSPWAAGGRLCAVTFSLHAFDNSETCDLVRTSPLIHNTIQLFFFSSCIYSFHFRGQVCSHAARLPRGLPLK